MWRRLNRTVRVEVLKQTGFPPLSFALSSLSPLPYTPCSCRSWYYGSPRVTVSPSHCSTLFWQGPAECIGGGRGGGGDRAKSAGIWNNPLSLGLSHRISEYRWQWDSCFSSPHPFFILYSLLFSQEGFECFVLFGLVYLSLHVQF